ncbi:hypothetical protein VVD49_03905 [Uliginosibacterium sp. H3]|uniref:Uncharacterized protein n=1 Tax=Uliginosibacterium silvisoli TaxID=3114758 RepID=A0ABU6JZR6_9RHOO|nr:hypothetical protein [Uliginosibacterium sp. H3]
MKISFPIVALLGLALAACGGNDNGNSGNTATSTTEAKVSVTALGAGSYDVVLGDESTPTVGHYYAAADGSRYLIVDDSNALATAVYKDAADGSWKRVPASASDVSISFLSNSTSTTLKAIDLNALARSYVALVQGSAVAFSLSADGKIVASSSASCKLNGTVGADVVQGARKLSLSTAGCGALPATLQGLMIADGDYAPAVLRFVLDDGSQITELWAYAE